MLYQNKKIELFLQNEINKLPKNQYSLLRELYERKSFSNEELLYLFPNNKLKRYGLPMKRGGSKKKREKRKIIRSWHVFNIIEDLVDDIFDKYENQPFFNEFVEFKDVCVGDTKIFYVSDYEDKCKRVIDSYIRENRYKPITTSKMIKGE